MGKIIDKTYLSSLVSSYGIVLVEGEINDYKAYLGAIFGADEDSDLMIVQQYGAPLSYEEAKGFFPYIEKDKYRL